MLIQPMSVPNHYYFGLNKEEIKQVHRYIRRFENGISLDSDKSDLIKILGVRQKENQGLAIFGIERDAGNEFVEYLTLEANFNTKG